ncbi:uncharacterized protein LOC107817084 [Nicotiana tabacum]|uniref:Uncharacterized protein LOC107817084 n=1 Tax=Nicotiana tabacum TaxID=4097 RepID=A0A1S4CB49_TOBAC|nr:uncharacterized protein LOC104094419 [Nicotiana tomentosiformis]XP_016498346.1 PREDICTED: uncharacterized protein LOC107817084 [Nicotiana tabacum]
MFFSLSSQFLKHNILILIPILPFSFFVYIQFLPFLISFFLVWFLSFGVKMPTEGVTVEEPVLCGSPLGSTPSSPKSRIKFLCSHGGKILPQPADGHLKYVGGETRVISVPRDIKLSELMKKLTPQIEGDIVLKYQLVHEDLDALVSVKTEEDLRHMLDEYDRCESAGIPRLRAFLFPAKPVVVDHHTMPSEPLEQRYIDAINGIIRAREAGIRVPPLSISHASFNISSACSSPRSPESCTTDGVIQESLLQSIFQNRSQLHKVQSSPSFYNVTSPQQHGFHHTPQSLQQQLHYYNYRQPTNYNGYQLSKPPPGPGDPLKGPERLVSVRSVGRAEGLRYQVDHNQHYYQSPARHSRGSGCCTKCMHYDDYGHCGERRNGSISPGSYSMEMGNGCPSPGGYSVERRTSSLSPSPIPLSPRFSNMAASGDT